MGNSKHISVNERAAIKQARRFVRQTSDTKIPLAAHYELGRTQRAYKRLGK